MSFGAAELAEVLQLVRAVARSEIMPRFRRLAAEDVSAKSGPLDLVTVADEAAEARLTTGLLRLFPGCRVVGEEATARDPASIEQIGMAGRCFVVDPIDGTSNYAAGLPLFGVIVAVVEDGETVGALIHDPVGDDTAMALRGQGAWLEQPDEGRSALRVAAAVPVGEMTGSVSWRYMREPVRSRVCARLPLVGAAWDYRCGAYQYRLLATGHAHYAVYNRLLPWDHAAGVLLQQEAGGYAALLDDSPYRPGVVAGGMICAPDRGSFKALRAALFAEVGGG